MIKFMNMLRRSLLIVFMIFSFFLTYAAIAKHEENRELSLQGIWKFKMDPQDKGIIENWCNSHSLKRGQVKEQFCFSNVHTGKRLIFAETRLPRK